jgi:hypothetical protein
VQQSPYGTKHILKLPFGKDTPVKELFQIEITRGELWILQSRLAHAGAQKNYTCKK